MKLLLVEDHMEISQMLKDYLETEDYRILALWMEKRLERNLIESL